MTTDDIKTTDDIAAWLAAVKFKKTTFGGVDERDVWQKIDQLNDAYARVYSRQEAAWQAKLSERETLIRKLRAALKDKA